MKLLLPLFPSHSSFVDVFGGSGAVILNKPHSELETFNDADKHIFNLFSVLQDNRLRKQLVQKIEFTPGSNYDFFMKALNILKQPIRIPVEAAWAFLVAASQSICPVHPATLLPSEWGYSCKPHKIGSRTLGLPDAIERVARRFERVQITNWDWRRVLAKFDRPWTLFYLDPPYWPITKTKEYYAHQMSEADHKEMLATLQTIEGYAMISGYASSLYGGMLLHWRKVIVPSKASAVVTGPKPDRIEIVWMNYRADGTKVERNKK
jgi:DNA adenine methylase